MSFIKNKIALSSNGGLLIVNKFSPLSNAKACIIIASAMAVKQSYYQNFAQFLSDNDYIVYTFDYVGIGESKQKSINTYDGNASDMATNDIEIVVKNAKQEHPDLSLLYVGHSIGGQILGMVPSKKLIDGIIFVAVASGSWRKRHGIQKYKMLLFLYILSPFFVGILGYLPGFILGSENLPKSVAKEWCQWCKKPNYLFDCVNSSDQSYTEIQCPLVAYSSEDDVIVAKNVVDWMTDRYLNAITTKIHLRPKDLNIMSIGHFGFFKSKY